jgi:hypothetical protein
LNHVAPRDLMSMFSASTAKDLTPLCSFYRQIGLSFDEE